MDTKVPTCYSAFSDPGLHAIGHNWHVSLVLVRIEARLSLRIILIYALGLFPFLGM